MLRGTIYTLMVAVVFGLGVYAGRATSQQFPPETVEPPLADPIQGPFRPRPPKPDPPLPEPDTADFTPRERVLFGRFRELIDSSNARAESRETRRDARTAQQIEEALTEVSEYDPQRIQAGGFWATVASKLWEWIKKAVTKIVETVFKAKTLDFEKDLFWKALPYLGGAVVAIFGGMWGFAKLISKRN